MTRGNRERTQESTAANSTSSRSHALLIVNVKQQERATGVRGEVKSSRLYMIDLAGSERASYTQVTVHNKKKWLFVVRMMHFVLCFRTKASG